MQQKKLTVQDIRNRKNGNPISALTAYDYPWAKAVDEAGIDIVLVGDSLGMVVLGYPDTVSVTMEDMIHHTKAVARGVMHALVITDMPFGSHNSSTSDAIKNATRILKEGRADAVKIEGGVDMAKTVEAIVKAGIPVQGHIGLTPQTASNLGGFKVQGKNAKQGKQLIDDARAFEDAGCFSVVLEAIPAPLGEHITKKISVPTIGIGVAQVAMAKFLLSMIYWVFMTGFVQNSQSNMPGYMILLSKLCHNTEQKWSKESSLLTSTASP
jgi:3-methyl-2-oxobutanoate hydroxymethyltransferase